MADVPTKIKDLRHRVALCTQRDVVEKDGTMQLSRHAVVWAWADIEMQWHIPSFMSQAGYAIKELPDRSTHHITVRAALGIEVSAMAWVYELRRKGPPRWYKVIGFGEADHFLVLTCHLVERSDDAQPPHSQLSPIQSEVNL